MVDISEQDREYFHTEIQQPNKIDKQASTFVSIAKVFGVVSIGLLISAIVAFGVGALVFYYFALPYQDTRQISQIFVIITAVSLAALLIDSLIINFVILRGKHSILIPGIIYSVLVGTAFSMLTIVVNWSTIGMAFGITALCFVLMSLISFLSKGNMSPILLVILALFVGTGLLILADFIIAITTGRALNWLYIGISIGILAIIMFTSIYDLWRIKTIAADGMMNKSMTLYCAFVIYTDFISLFIRILYFLLIIFARKK